MATITTTCTTCKHFFPFDTKDPQGNGFCKRFPPVRNTQPGLGGRLSSHPAVQGLIDSCGEHTKK